MYRLMSLVALTTLLLLPTLASAITVTPTGTTADVTYTEPTTNADTPPTPLTDLRHCNVYAKPTTGVEIKFPDVLASAPTGGAIKTVNVGVAKGSNYAITVSCTDLVGNESARSSVVTLDALPPNAPK